MLAALRVEPARARMPMVQWMAQVLVLTRLRPTRKHAAFLSLKADPNCLTCRVFSLSAKVDLADIRGPLRSLRDGTVPVKVPLHLRLSCHERYFCARGSI